MNCGSNSLNLDIARDWMQMLENCNPLVRAFLIPRDRFQQFDIAKLGLRLLSDGNIITGQYNSPSCSEVASLIIGDFDMHSSGHDIIVEHQTNGLHRISELHPSFMAVQYPLLFPYVEHSFYASITRRSVPGKQQ